MHIPCVIIVREMKGFLYTDISHAGNEDYHYLARYCGLQACRYLYLSSSDRFFISIDFINGFVQRAAVQKQLSRDNFLAARNKATTRSIHELRYYERSILAASCCKFPAENECEKFERAALRANNAFLNFYVNPFYSKFQALQPRPRPVLRPASSSKLRGKGKGEAENGNKQRNITGATQKIARGLRFVLKRAVHGERFALRMTLLARSSD